MAQTRMQLYQLKSLQELLSEPLPQQSSLRDWNQRLQALLVSSVITLQQFRLLLDACPDNQEGIVEKYAKFNSPNDQSTHFFNFFVTLLFLRFSTPVIALEGTQLSGLSGIIKGDGTWQKAVAIVDEALSSCNQSKKNVLAEFGLVLSSPPLVTVGRFKKMSQCINEVTVIANRISELKNLFGADCLHPCINSLKWLKEHMLRECQSFADICKRDFVSSDASEGNVLSCHEISIQVNDVMQNILVAIQSLYKDHTSSDESVPDQPVNGENDLVDENQKVG